MDETPTRRWFWLWVGGLAVSAAGYGAFMFGGIWLILLGTFIYAIAAFRSRSKRVLRRPT